MLDGLRIVKDLLAVGVVRTHSTTRVHHLLAVEELHVDERVLLTSVRPSDVIATRGSGISTLRLGTDVGTACLINIVLSVYCYGLS